MKKENPFAEALLKAWGDPEIFGPWTEELEASQPPRPVGELKFYKEYFLISDGRTPDIDIIPGTNLSEDQEEKYFYDKLKLASKIPKLW